MELNNRDFHLIDTLTLSSITGIGESTLRHWRCLKKGPSYIKLGGKVMYRSDVVDKWLNKNTVFTESHYLSSVRNEYGDC